MYRTLMQNIAKDMKSLVVFVGLKSSWSEGFDFDLSISLEVKTRVRGKKSH